jgi:integrase
MATLVKRGNRYAVRYVVPTKLRPIIGRTQIWKTTGTGCLSEAKKREPRILADILDSIERTVALKAAEPTSKASVSWVVGQLRDILANPPDDSGLSDESIKRLGLRPDQISHEEDHPEDLAAELIQDIIEQHLAARGESPDDISAGHIKALRNATKMVTSGGTFVPVSEAVERHLAEKDGRINPSSLGRKRNVLESFAEFAGNPDVASVDRAIAGRYVSEVLLPDATIAVATKKGRIAVLSAAWVWFERKGLVTTNPWRGMNADVEGSKRGKEKLVKRPWTPDEIDQLKTVDPTDPIYTVSVIRLHCGARVEEICSLKTSDVDLDAGTIRIREGKTQSSVRTLAAADVIMPILRQLVENATEDGRLYDFPQGGRDKRRSYAFNKRIGEWIRRHVSKDPALTSYTLRHTYSQALRDLGVDQATIEFTTGHKDQSMLFGTYATEVGIERLREAVNKLDFGF